MGDQQEPLLKVRDLKKYFPVQRGFLQRNTGYVKAVDGVDLEVQAGETLGVVGESGSGKTTLGRCVTKLYDLTDGDVILRRGNKEYAVSKLKGDEN